MNTNMLYPNIEAERARLGLTQEEFSERLGIERKTYYNWLTKGKIPVKGLIDISNFCECSIDYLLGRTTNPKISA